MTGYLPGDPRYGLSGEALRNYYRTKQAQWAIYCWDKPGTKRPGAPRAGPEELRQTFGERHQLQPFRLRRRRHIGTSFFGSRPRGGGHSSRTAHAPGRRLPARRFTAGRTARSARPTIAAGHAAVPVHGTQDRFARVLPRTPARARVILRVVRRQLHLPRTDPVGRRRRQHRHRAPLELPDRAAADKFWNEGRSPGTADIRGRADRGGCSATTGAG